MTRHMLIPDTQVKEGVPMEHLRWAGEYAVAMQPDVIIHIGDHWDFPSLSSYDRGKGVMEGRRYLKDIEAGNEGLDMFMQPIARLQASQRRNKKKVWEPRLIFCVGNHEHRIDRAVNDNIQLADLISLDDTNLEDWGFEVVPFLKPVVVDGICYAHYLTSGVMGRPCSSARLMLNKKHMSCVMGHVQDRDIAWARRADGKQMTGLFAGIFYQHDEEYLNPQTNESWRGLWIFNEVEDGSFDELPVSLNYLEKKYG
jgi:hypothetical protein